LKSIACKIVIAILVLLGCLVVFRAVRLHGTTPLGHGYRYFHAESGVVVGFDMEADGAFERIQAKAQCEERDPRVYDGLLQVGPNVDGYRVYDRAIVGHVECVEGHNPNYKHRAGDSETPGYFIIDVTIDRVYNGLNKREWLEELRKFGVRSEPRLFRPSVFDKFLGRNKPTK